MSCFLKYHDDSLMMVDYSPRKGLYYQVFTKDQATRPTLLLTNGTYEYTAFLDGKEQYHVIAKNNRNQIIHMSESSNTIQKQAILDDYDNAFKIINLYALSLKNQFHLFYFAMNPSTKNPELIYHLLQNSSSTPIALGEIPSNEVNFDCFKFKDNIILAMINKDNDNYLIKINSINSNGDRYNLYTPVCSKFPISCCKIIIDKSNIYHLIYVQEKYGQYQLMYKNNKNEWSDNQLLYSCGYLIKPILLIYHDALWINWNENGILKAILSVDMGENFSEPINNSIQDSNISLHSYDGITHSYPSLICNQLYGINQSTPKFVLLHSLDMDGIHPHLNPNIELKLYLSHIKNQLKISVSKTELEEKNKYLKNEIDNLTIIQNNITTQYNELADLTKKIQDEGKKWRESYNEAKNEIEFHKKRAKQLEKLAETKMQVNNADTQEEPGNKEKNQEKEEN